MIVRMSSMQQIQLDALHLTRVLPADTKWHNRLRPFLIPYRSRAISILGDFGMVRVHSAFAEIHRAGRFEATTRGFWDVVIKELVEVDGSKKAIGDTMTFKLVWEQEDASVSASGLNGAFRRPEAIVGTQADAFISAFELGMQTLMGKSEEITRRINPV